MEHYLFLIALIVSIIVNLVVITRFAKHTTDCGVTVALSTYTYYFNPDQWIVIRQSLTHDDLVAVRALDKARTALHRTETLFARATTSAERAHAQAHIIQAQATFNEWAPLVYRAYQRATTTWLRTSDGQTWLVLHNLPDATII